jgi:hypothetical protein
MTSFLTRMFAVWRTGSIENVSSTVLFKCLISSSLPDRSVQWLAAFLSLLVLQASASTSFFSWTYNCKLWIIQINICFIICFLKFLFLYHNCHYYFKYTVLIFVVDLVVQLQYRALHIQRWECGCYYSEAFFISKIILSSWPKCWVSLLNCNYTLCHFSRSILMLSCELVNCDWWYVGTCNIVCW